jgi:hypothetical protein
VQNNFERYENKLLWLGCLGLFVGCCLFPASGYGVVDEGSTSEFDPIGDTINASRIFIEDGWHIFSSPARMSSDDAFKLGAYLTITGIIFTFDEEILELIQRNEDSAILKPLWEIGDFLEPVGHMGNTNAYFMGGMAVGYVTGMDKVTLICGQLLESHWLAGLGKNLAGELVGRSRPYEEMGAYSFGNKDSTSFPSGHASNIFQVATILSYHVDRKPFTWTAYACAGLVGLQRVRSDMHWPSDVFLSAVYGTAVARAVLKLHEKRDVTVMPHVSHMGVGMQIGWRF